MSKYLLARQKNSPLLCGVKKTKTLLVSNGLLIGVMMKNVTLIGVSGVVEAVLLNGLLAGGHSVSPSDIE